VEVEETDSAAAASEPGTTWREALSSCVTPADHRLSDEEIFTILNGERDDAVVAELWAARNVSLPMYCVWKSKYRQLDLEQLRNARRREQRRRHAVIGAAVIAATVFVVGIGGGLVWAVSSTFKGLTTVSSAATVKPQRTPHASSATVEPRPIIQRTSQSETANPRPVSVAVAPAAETGYRIQVTAAETEQEGRAAVAQLAAKGYRAYMTRVTVGSKNVVRVRVGPFDTALAAEEIATQLRSAGYQDVWIARP
jgi:cell division septation protein DedD